MILDRMRLDGKVALVTGGSQGLGLGMALSLAEAGADVAIVARREHKLAEASEQLQACGRRVLPLSAVLADLDDALRVVDAAAAELGRLDILVPAAAQLRKPALEVTPEEWDRIVAVNQRAVYFMRHRAARHVLRREPHSEEVSRGKIINIVSLTAVGALRDVSVYGMTKGGVAQMTKATALEWAPHGICVNAIGPGAFHAELTDALYSDPERDAGIVRRVPMGRPGRADDLADATVYLASPASDYVTGQVLWVDGGWLVG